MRPSRTADPKATCSSSSERGGSRSLGGEGLGQLRGQAHGLLVRALVALPGGSIASLGSGALRRRPVVRPLPHKCCSSGQIAPSREPFASRSVGGGLFADPTGCHGTWEPGWDVAAAGGAAYSATACSRRSTPSRHLVLLDRRPRCDAWHVPKRGDGHVLREAPDGPGRTYQGIPRSSGPSDVGQRETQRLRAEREYGASSSSNVYWGSSKQ